MNKKWKQICGTGLLVYILVINIAIIGVAAESSEGTIIIGDDPEKDLRLFYGDWLTDEFEDTDWDDTDESLDEIYNKLERNWDSSDACEKLYDNTGEEPYYNPENLRTYSDYDFVDILQVRVENLHKSRAKMVVDLNGDAEDTDYIWFIFVWSDCGGKGDKDISFMGYYLPEIIEGGMTYYEWEQGSDGGNDTIDFDNDGHTIEMEFDSDNWDEVEDCQIKAMMMSTKDELDIDYDDADMVVDIFPGKSENSELWWLWILLIIIIIIIALLALYFYLKKRKQNKNVPKVKGGGERSYRKWSLVF